MRIFKDTPKEILDMLYSCDFYKLQNEKQKYSLGDLNGIIEKYRGFIPKRTTTDGEIIEIDIPYCPKEIIGIVNANHWAKINTIYKKIALPLIKMWFQKNIPQRKFDDKSKSHNPSRSFAIGY